MQADFAVELGADDPVLEIPWSAEDGGTRYWDLKRHPELIANLEEVTRVPELGHFLAKVNSSTSALESAKCDAWSSNEINPEEEIFENPQKFCSYVDLLFANEAKRFALPEHERLAKGLVELLKRAPEISATAEFLIRRCYFEDEEGIRDGFYFTFYLFAYGKDEIQSRNRWAVGLKLVQNAIRQASVDLA